MASFEAGMEGMVEVFIYESTTLLEQLEQILMRTESNNSFDDEDINEIFRIMHTIKGSSAMMGLSNMSALAHSMEDMFFIIREEKPYIISIQNLYDLVFTASDLLKAEVEMIQEDNYTPTDFSEHIGKIKAFVAILKDGSVTEPEQTAASSEDNSVTEPIADDSDMIAVRVFFDDDCEMENLRSLLLIKKIKEDCLKLEYEPSDIETNADSIKTIINNGFLIKFKPINDEKYILKTIEDSVGVKSYEVIEHNNNNAENAEALPGFIDLESNTESYTGLTDAESSESADEPLQAKTDTTEQTKPITNDSSENLELPKSAEQINNLLAKSQGSKGKQNLITVNLNKLDQLLDMVGEIVITEAMVTSSADLKGLKLDNFNKSARQLRKLTDELQDIVMSIRMVPLSGVFNKMTRVVRDMKVKLNKDVNLVFEGEETEVDKGVIDNLNDPLMHMVRNSMDHGIEDDPQERIKLGKPEKGTVTLSAYNASGEVIIVVADDGAGINTKKVLEKAKRNGLLTKPESEYTDKEIFNMIMLPGFSTNEEVTEFSGRGVGMDVVRQNIEKIGGSVSVESKQGVGTSFIIKIPLSLAIVGGIEISVGPSIFTIPINSVKESFKLNQKQLIRDMSGKEIVMIRGKCYPLIRLYEFYDLTPKSTDVFDGMVILVEGGGKQACLLADELIGEQQVVVKPFSPLLNRYNVKQNGMAGCTILGDGSITIILDINNIIQEQ